MATANVVKPRTIPRAEQVGSLLRPAHLLSAYESVSSFDRNKVAASDVSVDFADADQTALRELEDECIRDAVEKQKAAGLDVLSDGEFRRVFFIGSFDAAVHGYQMDPEQTIVFANDKGDRYELPGRPVVAERLTKIASPGADEARFMAQVAGDYPFKVTFPAASLLSNPAAFKAGLSEQAYRDPAEMIQHTLEILRELIDDAVAAGATYIQLDYPFYVLWVDETFRQLWSSMGLDLDQMLESMLEADRKIVEGLPDHVRTALHLCRGNFRGTWMASGSLESVAEQIFSLPYDTFLVEWDDTNRMGDYSAIRHAPKGPVIGMGLISTKDARLEPEDEVLRHLEEATRFLDVDQLAICPQCGFASEAAGNDLTEDEQWRKLELVSRVADRVWAR